MSVVKEIKDVNTSFPYNQKRAIAEIRKRLERNRINFDLNQYSFRLIANYFHLYEDPTMCYKHQIYDNPTKTFSEKLIQFMVNEISKDSNIVLNIKKKTVDPRSMGF